MTVDIRYCCSHTYIRDTGIIIIIYVIVAIQYRQCKYMYHVIIITYIRKVEYHVHMYILVHKQYVYRLRHSNYAHHIIIHSITKIVLVLHVCPNCVLVVNMACSNNKT